MTTTPIGIAGIVRTDTKQTDLTIAQYNGQARPGEIVVDLTTYNAYVANLTGNLFPLGGGGGGGGGGTAITNGTTTVDIPNINSDVFISVDGVNNVGQFSKTGFALKGNFVPVSNNLFNLGSPTNQWKDLYLSQSTIYFNNIPLGVGNANQLVYGNANVVTTQANVPTILDSNIVYVTGILAVANRIEVTGQFVVGNAAAVQGNFSVGGISNLGPVSNVKITGGANGYLLQTDGNGNVSWTTIPTRNGNSQISIPVADGPVEIISNNSPIASFGSNLITVIGNTLVTGGGTFGGNVSANNFATTGNVISNELAVLSRVTFPNPANISIPGGNIGDVLTTNGGGGLSWQPQTGGGGGGGGSFISNIASNVVIPSANGNVFVYQNTALSAQFGNTNSTFYGNVTVANIVSANNIRGGGTNVTVNSNSYLTVFDSVGNVTLPANTITPNLYVTTKSFLGAVANVNITGGNNGQFLQTNGSGTLVWANGSNGTTIFNGNSNVTIAAANGNVSINSGGNLIANATGANLDVFGTLYANANASIGNLVVRNLSNLGPATNLRISGGAVNQVLTSNGAGGVTWANVTVTGVSTISNGSSFATIQTFDGPVIISSAAGVSANLSDQLYVTGNAVMTANLIVQRGTFLGPIGNVRISGGTNNQVLTTNGNSGLRWMSVPGLSDVDKIVSGNTTIFISAVDGTISAVAGPNAKPIWNAQELGNGAGSFSIAANVMDSSAITTYNNLQYFSNLVYVNAVANFKLGGGTSGQYLQTDGAAGLSWSTIALSNVANGTSNLSIVGSANVNTSVNGVANVFVVGTSGIIANSLTTINANIVAQNFVGPLANGTSNVRIATNGDLGVSINGTSNSLVVSSSTITITGNLSVSNVITARTTQEFSVALGGATTINAVDGAVFTRTITAPTTFTVTNVGASSRLTSFILELTNGGAFSITWWAGMKWAGGVAPLLTTSGRDILGFYTVDGGVTWNGLLLGKDMK